MVAVFESVRPPVRRRNATAAFGFGSGTIQAGVECVVGCTSLPCVDNCANGAASVPHLLRAKTGTNSFFS